MRTRLHPRPSRWFPSAVGVLALGALAAPAASVAAAAPGRLDTAFGGRGVVTLDPGTRIEAAVVQTDGKVVLAGSSGDATKPVPYAARLNRDGSRDRTFNPQLPTGGAALGGSDSLGLTGVALRSGGRLVFSGTARNTATPDGMVAVSLQASGARDTSFSGDGVAVVAGGVERSGEANDVAVAPDGKVVLGGVAYDPKTVTPAATVARLTTAGAPDGALGTGRTVVGGTDQSQLNAVAVQSDGGIVGVGQRTEKQPVLGLVTRVAPSGAIDTGFRGGGSFTVQYGGAGGGFSALNDVAIDASGRILATGAARRVASPSAQSITTRLSPGGANDGGFGAGGVRSSDASQTDSFPQPTPGGYGIALDGARTYVGGTYDAGIPQLSSALLNGSGAFDGSFGTGGQTRTGFGTGAVRGTGGVALGPDGLYVAGTAGDTGAVARVGAVARTAATPAPVPTPPADGGALASDPSQPAPTKPKAPTLSGTSLKPSKITRKKKAVLRFRFSGPGFLSIGVERKSRGRRSTSGRTKGDCVKASTKNRKGRTCTFYARVGSTRRVTVKKAGSAKLSLSRKVTTRTLSNGTYRLVLQALDTTRKAKGTVRHITFRVTTR